MPRDPVLDPQPRTRSSEKVRKWREENPDHVFRQSTSARARREAIQDLIDSHPGEFVLYLRTRRRAAGLPDDPRIEQQAT